LNLGSFYTAGVKTRQSMTLRHRADQLEPIFDQEKCEFLDDLDYFL
jgi:hypothetical protein